jgi:hypothetical protein
MPCPYGLALSAAECKIAPMGKQKSPSLHWSSPSHPVFWMETRRRVRAGAGGVFHYASLPVAFVSLQTIIFFAIIVSLLTSGPVTSISSTTLEVIMYVGPGIVFGFLLIVQLALGATMNLVTVALATPLISGEVELKSWELLRATALSLREILLAKISAALYQIRLPLLAVMIVRTVCTASGLFLFFAFSLSELRTGLRYGLGGMDTEGLLDGWLPVVAAVLAVALALFVQPLLQALMNTMLGMAASAFARSRGRALAAGFGIRLALWGVTSVLGTAGISLTIRAYDDWLWELPIYLHNELQAVAVLLILWVLIFLVTQTGITLVAWWLTARRARRLTETA